MNRSFRLISFFFVCSIFIRFCFTDTGKCTKFRWKNTKVIPKVQMSGSSENSRELITLSNDSFIRLTSFKFSLEMVCSAEYPIEWIHAYNPELDGMDLTSTRTIYSERVAPNGKIWSFQSNYVYSAFYNISYEHNACDMANFSCRSVEDPCLQNNVLTSLKRKPYSVSFRVTDEIQYDEVSISNSSGCPVFIAVGVVNKVPVPGWACQSSSERKFKLDFSYCDSAMHCNSFYRFDNSNSKCLRNNSQMCLNGDCKFIDKLEYKPGFVGCIDSVSGELELVQHYFFTVPQGQLDRPQIHFSWDSVNPQMMLYLHRVEDVYVGDTVNFTCSVSRYYFAYGYRIGFKHEDEEIRFRDGIAFDGIEDRMYQVNVVSVSILITPHLERVYCIAPVWNSTEWISQSIPIKPRTDSTSPTFVDEEDEKPDYITFNIGDTNKSIECKVHGKPTPELVWISPDDTSSVLEITKQDITESWVSLTIHFSEIRKQTDGEYICEARNFKGSIRKIFVVTVYDEMVAVLSTLCILGFVVVFVLILLLWSCWRKVTKQQIELRLLTEAEVKEFIKGNVEALHANNYLDTSELIQSLPYNAKFEIPKDWISIDKSIILGSGTFGQVLKGTVFNVNRRGGSISVAVKTVKQNMEVMYFKSLLSEVKIMSYLGKHPNIVGLVGACTQNIRRREIFIAVEYCINGSLENYLMRHQTSFKNFIVDDVIHAETSLTNIPSTTKTASYENVDNPLQIISTVNLIKWAREIANGMDYIGSKKIIHGDLAARNVFLNEALGAKIGDFGLSKQLINYSNYVKSEECPLPWKWLAIESLQCMKFSVQSDMWAYGVTLWEIFSLGQTPFPGMTWTANFLENLQNGVRMLKPTYATSSIYKLMLISWDTDPMKRPSFNQMKQTFDALLMDICPQEYFSLECTRRKRTLTRSMSSDDGYLSAFVDVQLV